MGWRIVICGGGAACCVLLPCATARRRASARTPSVGTRSPTSHLEVVATGKNSAQNGARVLLDNHESARKASLGLCGGEGSSERF